MRVVKISAPPERHARHPPTPAYGGQTPNVEPSCAPPRDRSIHLAVYPLAAWTTDTDALGQKVGHDIAVYRPFSVGDPHIERLPKLRPDPLLLPADHRR